MNNLTDHAGDGWAAFDKKEKSRRERIILPAKLLISATVFGALFAYLFTKQSIGLNMFVFVVAVYGFAIINRSLFIKKTFKEEKIIMLFSLPVVFLSIIMFTGSSPLNILSGLVILFILFVQYMALSGSAVYNWYQPAFLLDIIFGGINRLLLGIGFYIAGSANTIFKSRSEKKRSILIGIGIGLFMLMLVVPVLLIADAQAAKLADRAFGGIYLGDIFLYLLMFLIGASLITAPVATTNRAEWTGTRKERSFERRPVEYVTAVVALSMISIIYILFGTLQFTYFFQTRETMAAVSGLTSSAYAVRGFGEMIWLTCFNCALIAAAAHFVKQPAGRLPAALKALFVLLVAFNFVILASAHLRMEYYESSYGYTVARFLSHSFMAFLLIVNAAMLLKIFLPKVKLMKVIISAALIYYCAIAVVNPELAVARWNIQRYEATGKIDMTYMLKLPGDALSETCDFAAAHPGVMDEQAWEIVQARMLRYQKTVSGNWQSFNAADDRAKSKLDQYLSDMQAYPPVLMTENSENDKNSSSFP